MNNYFNGKGTIGFTCDICGRELNGCSIVNGMKFCAKCYQETFGKDNQQNEIQQLKQQLEEKGKEINQLKQEKKNAGEEKTRAYLDTLTKPKIIELCLQYINDKNIAEQQLEALMLEISKQEVEQHDLPDYCTRTGTDYTNLGKIEELQRQLAEKDKEIETMKKDSDKNIDYLVEFASLIENEKDCNRMLKALDRVKSGNKYIIDKANQSKTEFAIQELEKVKNKCNGMYELWLDSNYKENMYNNEDIAGVFEDISVFTNDLIKKLKG